MELELSLSGKANKELTGERVKTIFYDLVQEVLSERESGKGVNTWPLSTSSGD